MENSAEVFQSRIDLAGQNCAGAIRAFGSIYPILSDYKSHALSDLITDLIHHTLQSGLMSLCRIWDKRQDVESLHTIIDLMSAEETAKQHSSNLVHRIDFEHAFADSIHARFPDIPCSDGLTDHSAFLGLAQILEKEAQAIKSSHQLAKIMRYRSKYLAHTTTQERLARDKIITENDYKPVLEKTIAFLDKLLWLTKGQNDHLAAFFCVVSDNAHDEWGVLSKSWNVEAA